MTGNHHTSASSCARVLTRTTQAIEQAEQQLHTIQHELQLLADLAATGLDASGHLLSIETISVVLGSYADRVSGLRSTLKGIATETQIRGDDL